MAKLQDDDCLLVGRDNVDYKVSYQDLVGSLESDINIPSPNLDAYARLDGAYFTGNIRANTGFLVNRIGIMDDPFTDSRPTGSNISLNPGELIVDSGEYPANRTEIYNGRVTANEFIGDSGVFEHHVHCNYVRVDSDDGTTNRWCVSTTNGVALGDTVTRATKIQLWEAPRLGPQLALYLDPNFPDNPNGGRENFIVDARQYAYYPPDPANTTAEFNCGADFTGAVNVADTVTAESLIVSSPGCAHEILLQDENGIRLWNTATRDSDFQVYNATRQGPVIELKYPKNYPGADSHPDTERFTLHVGPDNFRYSPSDKSGYNAGAFLNCDVHADHFVGDGSRLTNLPTSAGFPEAPADGNLYVRNGQTASWERGLPYDIRTLPELS